jgi:hypothetical protein
VGENGLSFALKSILLSLLDIESKRKVFEFAMEL